MNKFRNSVAVITGAGSGIGQQLCCELAKAGAHLAIVDIDANNLAQTKDLIESINPELDVQSTVLDVSNKDAIFKLAEATQAHFGKVNLVINNAGVAMSSGNLWETSVEDIEWLMGINFNGVLYGTKAFLPMLEKSQWGHIVNISSIFGIISAPEQAHYNASKFAVRGLTESLRQELEIAQSHISCTCVHPGGIKTNIAKNARISKELDEKNKKLFNNFEDLAMTTAESAANQILNGVIKNKRRVIIGKDGKLLDWVQRHFPNHYQKVFQWFVDKTLK